MRSKQTLRTKRSLHVALGTIMLTVPASAVALTSASASAQPALAQPDDAASATRLQVEPRRVTVDHPVTVTGVAPRGAAGRKVLLETAVGRRSSWRRLGATRVGAGGEFRLRVWLQRSGLVRVIDAAALSGATGTTSATAAQTGGAPTSAASAVTVAGEFRVASGPLDVLGGESVQVGGRLLPARAGRRVALQGHFATGWQTLASSRTGPAGGFRLSARPGSGMQRRLRVRFAGDPDNGASVAPAGRLTVYTSSVASWYDDSGDTACGFHAGLGVANTSLPCGTKVRLRYGGRSVTAVVDDRGPYVGGRTWDLNQNTAAALGFGGVDTVWSAQ